MSKVTTLEEFRESLLATGGYETADDHRPAKRAKPGALVTLGFTMRMCKVFPLCALYEPFGKLTTDKWAHFCFSVVTGAERLGMKVMLEGWKRREAYDGNDCRVLCVFGARGGAHRCRLAPPFQ